MNTTQLIRVMLVDDHAMVRKGLVAFLKNMPELELVGEACDGREAIEFCEQRQPDVILMDLGAGCLAGRGDWLPAEERLGRGTGRGYPASSWWATDPGTGGRPGLNPAPFRG